MLHASVSLMFAFAATTTDSLRPLNSSDDAKRAYIWAKSSVVGGASACSVMVGPRNPAAGAW